MKVLGIAIRNVRRQRRRALLLGGAVAVSFCAMALMEGLTGGMARSLRANVEAGYVGELYVSGEEWREGGSPVRRLRNGGPALRAIEAAGLPVEAVVPKSGAEAQVVYGGRSARVTVAGIPWEGGRSAIGSPAIATGSLDAMAAEDGIVLPAAVAERLGVVAGETVLVKASTVTGQANVAEFTVAATTEAKDGGELFQAAYARIEAVNALIGLPRDGAQQLNVFLEGESDLEAAAGRLLSALRSSGEAVVSREPKDAAGAGTDEDSGLPGGKGGPLAALFGGGESGASWEGTRYTVATLDDYASQFLSILGTIKGVSVVVFLALLSISAAGIVNTFRMILIERTREIGAMRAMGMRARDVERLFVLEALVISVLGSLAGLAAAAATMGLASLPRFGGGQFALFLSGGRLAFAASPVSLLAYLALVAGVSALAARGPARAAARLKPVDALRS